MYQIDNSSAASTIPPSTSAGLAGFFTDGDPVANIAPTVLPAEFMNMLMMELLNVLAAAGVTPSKNNFTQLTLAISQLVRSGASGYGIDTGAANVYTVPYSPAVTAATDGMLVRFKAKTTNTGASTFAPDNVTAKPLIGAGALPLQGGEIIAGGTCSVIWLSALGKWVLLGCTGGAVQVAPGSASAHAMTIAQMQTAYGVYALDSGTANTYVAAFAPAITALVDGTKLTFQALAANTGASTLNINGLGAKPLIGGAQQPLQGGEIIAGGKAEVIYHGGLDSWVLWTGGGSPQVPTATQPLHAINLAQAPSFAAPQYVKASMSIGPGAYLVDTTPATAIVLTLPPNPLLGMVGTFTDPNNNWGQRSWVLARSGKTIMGKSEDMTVNVGDQQFSIYFNGTDWRLF